MHSLVHEFPETGPFHFWQYPAESQESNLLVGKPVDVCLEENLRQQLHRELLVLLQHLPPIVFSPVIRFAEDVGEVELLQRLILTEGRGQTGIQGSLDVHVLSEVDEGGESCHSSRVPLLIPGQLLRHELCII